MVRGSTVAKRGRSSIRCGDRNAFRSAALVLNLFVCIHAGKDEASDGQFVALIGEKLVSTPSVDKVAFCSGLRLSAAGNRERSVSQRSSSSERPKDRGFFSPRAFFSNIQNSYVTSKLTYGANAFPRPGQSLALCPLG